MARNSSPEATFGDEDNETFSVSEFVKTVNQSIKQRFGRGVWLHGEIQEMKTPNHVYFTLVDQDGEKKAVLGASIWQGVYQSMAAKLAESGLQLADGLKVRVFGEPDLYAGNGRFSFKVSKIDPRFTLGDLIAQREEVVKQLKLKKLYDANRAVDLAMVPLRVGIITSIGSAAHADVLKTFKDSKIGFTIFVHDARVQGDDAIDSVVKALQFMDARKDLDLLLLVRGGGSKNDLMAFDSPQIATTIGKCRLPVFTGIGHETDFSVADEVAHQSHKTPTACATAVIEIVREFIESTEQAWDGIATLALRELDASASRLADRANKIGSKVLDALAGASKRLAMTAQRIKHRPEEVFRLEKSSLDAFADRVRLLDPVNTMARGWSITRNTAGNVVRDVTKLKTGDKLVTTFANGSTASTVQEISTKGK
ncbi:exodeoxyribonuclease 7 large subunit [Actinomycetes bacterium]|nr:exodeoxyribonuclease 7 large subunit [Actinomycetes bacterium]